MSPVGRSRRPMLVEKRKKKERKGNKTKKMGDGVEAAHLKKRTSPNCHAEMRVTFFNSRTLHAIRCTVSNHRRSVDDGEIRSKLTRTNKKNERNFGPCRVREGKRCVRQTREIQLSFFMDSLAHRDTRYREKFIRETTRSKLLNITLYPVGKPAFIRCE